MPASERYEYVLERGGACTQLVHSHAVRRQLGQESGYRPVQRIDLELEALLRRAYRAHAIERLENADVERCPGDRRELHHVLRAERSDELLRRTESYHLPMIHDRDPVAETLGLVHVVRGEERGATGGAELLD